MGKFATKRLRDCAALQAPDGSTVRLLHRMSGGGMASDLVSETMSSYAGFPAVPGYGAALAPLPLRVKFHFNLAHSRASAGCS